jgi:hypothetical protein
MDSNKDFDEVASALKNVATLMDTISIQLQNTNGERDQKFDLIRCALEDFREDLEEQKTMTKTELWAWLDTCPTRSWQCVDIEGDYCRVVFPIDNDEDEP